VPRVQIATYPTNPESGSGSEIRSVLWIEHHQIRIKRKTEKIKHCPANGTPSNFYSLSTLPCFLKTKSTHLLPIRLKRVVATHLRCLCPSRPRPPSPDAPVALTKPAVSRSAARVSTGYARAELVRTGTYVFDERRMRHIMVVRCGVGIRACRHAILEVGRVRLRNDVQRA